MEKAVSVALMRDSDAWTIAHKVPSKELMRRAGEGIFRSVEWKGPAAVVCGSGNNAGDGYVVADLLSEAGIDVTIILLSDKFSEDGKFYFERCEERGVPVRYFCPAASPAAEENGADSVKTDTGCKPNRADTVSDFSSYAMILDCILGTGFQGEPRGAAKAAIEAINSSGAYVISADINSGLNGDNGLGTTYVRSDLTVSIGDYKLGHFLGLAKTAMKSKVNVDIGIEIQGEYTWME